MSSIVRTESHALATSLEVRADIERTIGAYRRAVRALSTVLMTHWGELGSLRNKCLALEALVHPTAKRPAVKYPVLGRMLGKMPSYLRRAAIEHAVGAVSSFQSNWSNFLDGHIGGRPREVGARGPRLGISNVFPSLYGGNMVLYGTELRSVRIKLLGADGQWRFSEPLALKGRFKRVDPRAASLPLSPSSSARSRAAAGAQGPGTRQISSDRQTFRRCGGNAAGARRRMGSRPNLSVQGHVNRSGRNAGREHHSRACARLKMPRLQRAESAFSRGSIHFGWLV